jgi:hypothetical protein
MQEEILRAFTVLDSAATKDGVLEACKMLFTESDEFTHSHNPFSESEVESVAKAIYEYIEKPFGPEVRQIFFLDERRPEGKAIEFSEYASRFSDDMLYQNCTTQFSSMSVTDLRRYLKVFLIALLFRYAFCADGDAVFRISKLLEYFDGLKVLLAKEERERDLSEAVLTTLIALRSVEPAPEEIVAFLEAFVEKERKRG